MPQKYTLFETARGHPFLLQRCFPCGDESPPLTNAPTARLKEMFIFAD